MRSSLLAALALTLLGLVSMYHGQERQPGAGWKEVHPGVWRSPGEPACYALVADGKALVRDAAVAPETVPAKTTERVLLTHHHRDTTRHLAAYRKLGVPVQASKESAAWLTPDGVQKYWKESLPLRGSRTAYLVLAEGVDGVDCSLDGGTRIAWNGWTIDAVATSGHSRDHVAYLARKSDGPKLLFSGDALYGDGAIWTPYTTDWDHWTDAGLTPLAKSLARLAETKADVLLPARGPIREKAVGDAIERTRKNVEEVAFLKSFERFTKQRLKDEPKYAFLAKEQAESNGSKPWTRVSEHLWLTGNTYVLTSKDGGCLVVDPWDPHSAKQLPKLQADEKLGPIEVVLASHAHFDHYDGWYSLLDRDKAAKLWTLDRVAVPLEQPYLLRVPFLDSRPLKVDRKFHDGEQGTWREYTFRFHFLPGQTEFTMGVEAVIDGKRCFFTADNWFHQDQFSGSGGWMGLNRSGPLPYAESGAKVLAAKPEWVLAEHGGPFEFHPEDWRRRVEWGKVAARAADALSPSGSCQHDWNPHRVRVEPVRVVAKTGAEVTATLAADNVLGRDGEIEATLAEKVWTIPLKKGRRESRVPVTARVPAGLAAGRHVLPVWLPDHGADAFLVLDVE